jgi:hypothetical protein
MHGKEKHIIVTSTQNGTTHYWHNDGMRVCVDIIPLRPRFEISNSEIQTALLAMTKET